MRTASKCCDGLKALVSGVRCAGDERTEDGAVAEAVEGGHPCKRGALFLSLHSSLSFSKRKLMRESK